MNNRAGHFRTSRSGETAYQFFVPSPLPPVPPVIMTEDLTALLVRVHSRLAVLECVATRTHNAGFYVSMLVRKEALLSSQTEGIKAALEDVFNPLPAASTDRAAAEVANCIRAAEFAVKRLKDIPLCIRLIKEIHAVLMDGTSTAGQGQEKSPGEFRHSQNQIGGQGSTPGNAIYIPPSPGDMAEAMYALEKYINAGDNPDVLIRAALVHYQFETLHPFPDGNGRIGRLLIALYLLEKKILSTPALPVSSFFKRNRAEYYDRMTEVRRTGNYEQWVKFFLQALAESADDAISAIDELARLHDKNAAVIAGMGRAAKNARLVSDCLERNPVIEIGKTAASPGLCFNTVSAAVKRLCGAGILKQSAGNARNRTFACEDSLAILRRDT